MENDTQENLFRQCCTMDCLKQSSKMHRLPSQSRSHQMSFCWRCLLPRSSSKEPLSIPPARVCAAPVLTLLLQESFLTSCWFCSQASPPDEAPLTLNGPCQRSLETVYEETAGAHTCGLLPTRSSSVPSPPAPWDPHSLAHRCRCWVARPRGCPRSLPRRSPGLDQASVLCLGEHCKPPRQPSGVANYGALLTRAKVGST